VQPPASAAASTSTKTFIAIPPGAARAVRP
jgi:hypothetical protein